MDNLTEEEADCANPELLSFLKEWRKGAEGTKAAAVYNQAYLSMMACPTAFLHPIQAGDLKGIGTRIVERLTQRLEEWCMQNNKPMPEVPARNARKRRVAVTVTNVEDGADPQPAPNPKRPRRRQKEYVPTYRSGAYGILIALWEAGDDMLTDDQLKELAQPHSDASYTVPSHTTSFRTAWGAMKTLIEKELVYARGVPQRFWLTETGKEVARAMLAGREPAACVAEGSGGSGEASGSSSRIPPGVSSGAAAVTDRLLENQAPQILSGGGLCVGGEDFGEEARLCAVAKVDEGSRRSGKPLGLGEDVIGNTDSPQALCSGRPAEYGMEPRPAIKQEKKPPIEFVDLENLTHLPPLPPPPRPPVLGVIAENPNIQFLLYAPPRSSSLNVQSPNRLIPCKVSPLPTTLETSDLHQPAQLKPSAPSKSRQSGPPTPPAFTPEVLAAGTFTIHLLLDKREVRAIHDRDYIATNLENAGVTPIIKTLKVGDVMWIARENGPTGREVVLDHIVERKRLDDLLFSVRDGRFHDQKFRLKKSGMRNVTYIIEDLTMLVLDAQTQGVVERAISSTQVVDGFFVKKTSKLDETIQYLVRMTTMLQKLYQSQDLYMIPDALVDHKTYPELLKHLAATFPNKKFFITYPVFSSLASKSGSLTLRDLLLKFLMVVRGITIEKACEIQKSFQTPRALVDAYERCGSDEEKLGLLEKACAGAVGRRKVSGTLSAKVAEVWTGVSEDGFVHPQDGE
ncbi:hypothetical protein DFP73DRAFT_566575 [Morchella snyderi]|nr:hypothetical protein DFP73DRAFT_566575 [Morchella snyderi]